MGGVRARLGRARNQCGLSGAGGIYTCCSARRACLQENSADVRSVGGGWSAAHFYFAPAAARRSLRAAHGWRDRRDVLDLLALGAGSDAGSGGGRRSGVRACADCRGVGDAANTTALLGAAWFVFPLLPYLPLPDHKMDYYLAVPSIGIAIVGAYAIARLRKFGRFAASGDRARHSGVYREFRCKRRGPSRAGSTHAREKVEDLVLGVEEVHQAAKGKIILLDGIDTDLFWSGVADLPFRAEGDSARVYLAPGSEARIQAAPDLLSKYVLPQAIARRALAANRCRGVPLRRPDAAQRYRTSGRALDRG